MAKALSLDWRARLVGHVAASHSGQSAAAKFAVAPSSAVRIEQATDLISPELAAELAHPDIRIDPSNLSR